MSQLWNCKMSNEEMNDDRHLLIQNFKTDRLSVHFFRLA